MEFGFKQYDELIFGKNQTDISPFSDESWNLITKWYWRIAGLIGGPILIAIVILSWKMIVAGISPEKRNEVKDNIMRLFFGAIAIGFAPLFVKFVLLLNNSLVNMLVGSTEGSLDAYLGNSLITNINTGNAIATAIVIALFAYLFIKMNIKFIIRQFTIIVFTIFTPIVSIFWIINKRTVASSIWFGQIIINVFMQFIYCFLFLIYMSFLPENAGWAISLMWAMMILPLGDALQNTMQNLVSRVAGVNNEELANRGIGLGAALGRTVSAIAYQFKGNNSNKSGGSSRADIIGKVAKRIIPSNSENPVPLEGKSYESHSKNIMEQPSNINAMEQKKVSEIGTKDINNRLISGVKKAYGVGKEFLNLGMYMAEGKNFRSSDSYRKQRLYSRYNTNETRKEDLENKNDNLITKKLGDGYEKEKE